MTRENGENIICKIYEYFHIYTIQTEQIKVYFEFVKAAYIKLLSHSKTCWVSLSPHIKRLIQKFQALKFFLSHDKLPSVIKKLFENEISEVYMRHIHS